MIKNKAKQNKTKPEALGWLSQMDDRLLMSSQVLVSGSSVQAFIGLHAECVDSLLLVLRLYFYWGEIHFTQN